MCFYIQHENRKPLTATKNIVCYKKMNFQKEKKEIITFSPYRYSEYNKKELYKVEKLKPIKNSSFSTLLNINYGFHSYTNLKKAKRHKNDEQIIIKCIIPKGATYYLNSYREEYVSTEIKATEIVMLDSKRVLRNKDLINKMWQ